MQWHSVLLVDEPGSSIAAAALRFIVLVLSLGLYGVQFSSPLLKKKS